MPIINIQSSVKYIFHVYYVAKCKLGTWDVSVNVIDHKIHNCEIHFWGDVKQEAYLQISELFTILDGKYTGFMSAGAGVGVCLQN